MGSGFVSWWASIVGVLAAGLVMWFWFWFVRHLLSTVENPVEVRQRGGLGWFALTPGVAAGAIAARSIIYWFSDMRYMANLVIIPIAGLPSDCAAAHRRRARRDHRARARADHGPVLRLGRAQRHGVRLLCCVAAYRHRCQRDLRPAGAHRARAADRGSRSRRHDPGLRRALRALGASCPAWSASPRRCSCAASACRASHRPSRPTRCRHPEDGPFQQPQRSGSVGVWSQALVMGIALVASGPTLWFMWLALTDDIANAMTGSGSVSVPGCRCSRSESWQAVCCSSTANLASWNSRARPDRPDYASIPTRIRSRCDQPPQSSGSGIE